MDEDHQEAIRLSRELNGNTRRNPGLPPPTMETRASKRARSAGSLRSSNTQPMTLPRFFPVVSRPASSLPSPPKTTPPRESVSTPNTFIQIKTPAITTATSLSATPPLPDATASFSLNPGASAITSMLKISPQMDTPNHDALVTMPGGIFRIQNSVGQNPDGTWFNETSRPTKTIIGNTGPETPMQASNPTPRGKPIVSLILKTGSGRTPSLRQKEKASQDRKRKATDDDFSIQEEPLSPESMEDIQYTPEKKAVRRRKIAQKSTSESGFKSASKSASKAKVPLYHESAQAGKPEPVGQPEVWAFKRQQLCETLPYYNAYQSGAYTHDNIARSIMIDKEVGTRDKFDEEVVITSVGGGRLLDDKTGKMVYKKDQIFSSTASAFKRAMELESPVAVIAGQGNKISPSKLPHCYNVLGWFHVTDVWQEKVLGHENMRVIIWKIRLEKIDLSKRSWWAAQTSHSQISEVRTTTERHICASCQRESKVMFNAGPACLHVSCSKFFSFGTEYDDNTLDYHPAFLGERTNFSGTLPDPISPPPINDKDLDNAEAFGYERICKRGIVCQDCGCCIRRIEWNQWACENPGCKYTYNTRQLPVPISKVFVQKAEASDNADNTGDYSKKANEKEPHKNILHYQSVVGPYDVHNYDLPNESGGIAGSIQHFKASRLINQQKDGPNDLFREMQASQLDLRRGAAVHKNTSQEILTNHFTQNFGAPYKYLVAQDSRGFDDAPLAVIKAAKRMIWAGQHALMKTQEPLQPFNECLVLGYFEGSKIGYHDDGEKTLGPTVATLSLGANAVMNFRPKKRAHIPALDGENPKSKGKGKSTDDKDKPAVVTVNLGHGDIVIMHGRDIQKLYEHEVAPNGGLRFALTCRHIDPQTLANDEERRIAAEKGTFPAGSERYDYDGSLHITGAVPELDKVKDMTRNSIAMYESGEIELSDMRKHAEDVLRFVAEAAESA